MDEPTWPALPLDDAALVDFIQRLLNSRVVGDPYAEDDGYARSIALLPGGLRAMAATHWLDLSLALDSITWHFGNFGEPALVAATEAGLRELGLHELAACFSEAKELMVPLLAESTDADGGFYQIVKTAGLTAQVNELDDRAWALNKLSPETSQIYGAWTRYARQHPDRVFN
jgi:hypothetical protein